MVKVKICKGDFTPAEIEQYKARAEELYGAGCYEICLSADGDFVDIKYLIEPFERIRRITGYLVGSLDRFNDAKRAEVADRVAHHVPGIS